MPAEPDEGLENAGVVAGPGTVHRCVVYVLQCCVGAQVRSNLERAVEQTGSLRKVVVRDVARDVVATERDARTGAVVAATDGESRRPGLTGVEEALDVIRVSDPRRCDCSTGELQAWRRLVIGRRVRNESATVGAAIQLRSEALVGPVVHAVARAVEILELTASALTIQILVIRENRRLVPRISGANFGASSISTRRALLGRDHDDAVRGARAV